MDASGDLPCVGKMEIAKPKPVGFLCGTLPVLTDENFPLSQSESALVPSTQTIQAPRYQMLPAETDLNTLPLLPNIPEKVFPAASKSDGDPYWESGLISQNLSRKCEALAVSGLTEYGDEIDVIAPADILKQIFKIPYSKARLSIAVHRIGDTLILNAGPDVEEGEKMFRRQSNQSRGANPSIFLNFAMHSVRAEACDCPPGHFASSDNQSSSTSFPEHYGHEDKTFVSSTGQHSGKSQFLDQSTGGIRKEGLDHCADYPQKKEDKFFWGNKKHTTKRHDSINKSSQVGEKPRHPVQESEKCRRVGNNGFLRVLFWQFHNFRMLLGSDLLLFSNEKFVAVSLHLWDVARQVTPLSWLEAWLDNVMASAPELAICYHRNGVVQGYELLKTDDIFLLKGISEDGTPAFHPQVVQQNGLSVLRFLQDNCKQDPGAYWLYKSAGEDVIQLFDLSVLPKNNSTDEHDRSCNALPSLMHKGRRESLFSLGTLLYRVAHRLSLSKGPDNKAKCAKFFKKCLDFLGEQDHLVVRAHAHEQFARLILRCYEELDLTSESFLLEYEATVTDMDDESSVFSPGMFGSKTQDKDPNSASEDISLAEDGDVLETPSTLNMLNLEANSLVHISITTTETKGGNPGGRMPSPNLNDKLALCQFTTSSPQVQTVVDPISSRLAAVHHVSQAIKSLRWNRQLQNTKGGFPENGGSRTLGRYPPANISSCACGDADCIEVCDIREWLTKAKMDHKLWKLVLLLGESYLALGEAYKEDRQLHRALKVVEIACSVYGSVPQHLDDAQFISSMVSCSPSSQLECDIGINKSMFFMDGAKQRDLTSIEKCPPTDLSSNYLFWAKAWALVGDVYVEYHRARGKDALVQGKRKSGNEMRMSNEVVREVTRLKKKLGRQKQNCSTCSLLNCSCQSDRASSGNSASSSGGGDAHSLRYGRKHSRKLNMRNPPHLQCGTSEYDNIPGKLENIKGFGGVDLQSSGSYDGHVQISSPGPDKHKGGSMIQNEEDIMKIQSDGSGEAVGSNPITQDTSILKHGGIFRFLEGPKVGDIENNLAAAIDCYDTAMKSLSGNVVASDELQSFVKKKGWVFNELGRSRLENRDLRNAELAFRDAIKTFREVSDHTNIILINCNIGHGRRALAEEMVTKMEKLRDNRLFENVYKLSLKTAKSEYIESLRYYEDAKTESDAVGGEVDMLLRNELYTQYANTYLRLGMLLARDDISEGIYESGYHEETSLGQVRPSNEKANDRKECDMSAGDAFREALSIYESLGELRKQEGAFAHFQLACYHKASCLKFLDLDLKQIKLAKCENGNRQKAKWYASLAERNWQKARDFYGPKTHSAMFLNILLELSSLSLSLSSSLHSNTMLESALSHMLEGRHVVEGSSEDCHCSLDPAFLDKFWNHLQSVLKRLLAVALSSTSNKSGTSAQPVIVNRSEDVAKLREMYRISLKSSSLDQLHAMYKLWIS